MANITIKEFWTSENEYDQAHIIVLRVLFSLRTALHHSIAFNFGLNFVLILLGIPLIAALIVKNNEIRQEIRRKQDFWSDKTQLEKLMKNELKNFKQAQKKKQRKHEKKRLKEMKRKIM